MRIFNSYVAKDGSPLTIRSATEDDAKAVTDISNAVVGETRFLSRAEEDSPDTEENIRYYIADCLDSEAEAFLVAEYAGEIVGFGHLDGIFGRVKYKHRCSVALSVLKAHWGKGIGRRLTRALIDCARSFGYEQVELNVIEENARAVGLYKSLGFTEYGREFRAMKFADGTYGDYLFMVKLLAE